MSGPPEHPHDRRQWFGRSLRYAALAGISSLSVDLLLGPTADAAAEDCPAPVDCRNCSASWGCNRAQRK